jgi:lipopolysaccharide exporter
MGLVSSILLARILTPEDFGAMSIIMFVIFFFEAFTSLGASTYLLTLEKISDDDINSAFTLGLLTRVPVALIVAFFSFEIANYFNKPELQLALAVCAFTPLFYSLANPKLIILRRNFEYSLLFKLSVTGKVFSFISTITLALIYESYWAMIIGSILTSSIGLFLGYYFYRYKPKICFSKIGQQWNYSKWLFFSAFLGYARSKSDSFFIAGRNTSHDLGLFSLSKEIGTLVYEQVAMPIYDIVITSGQRLINDKTEFNKIVELYLVLIVLIAAPVSFGLAAISEPLVGLLLGDKWLDMAPLLQILSYLGFFYSVTCILNAVISVKHKVKLSFFFDLALVPLLALALYFYSRDGIISVCIVVTLASSLYFLVNLVAVKLITGIKLSSFIGPFICIIFSSCSMYFIVIEFYQIFSESTPLLVSTFLSVLIGVVTYVVVVGTFVLLFKNNFHAFQFVFIKLITLKAIK